MAGINGTTVVVRMDIAGVPTVIGSQRAAGDNRTANPIDVTTKDDNGNRRIIPGLRSRSLTLDALYVAGNAAQAALKTAYENGTMVNLQRYEDGTFSESAVAMVSSFSPSHPDQDASIVSVSFDIDGVWA